MLFPLKKTDPSCRARSGRLWARRARLLLLFLLLLGLAHALRLGLGADSRGSQEPATAVGTPGSQDARESAAALLVQSARDLVAAGQGEQALTLLGSGGTYGTEEAVVFYRGLLEFDRASAYPISLDPLSAGRYAAPVEAVRLAALSLTDAAAAQAGYRQLLKADLFRRVGERELAEALLIPLLREQPDYRDAWLVWGELLLTEGEPERAREAFAQAELLDPDNRTALSGLARCGESAGDASAAAHRARLVELAPPAR